MNFKHIWIMFRARNREFFRDRAAFGWNFLFPFLIVVGFALIFGGQSYRAYKVGVFPLPPGPVDSAGLDVPARFRDTVSAIELSTMMITNNVTPVANSACRWSPEA